MAGPKPLPERRPIEQPWQVTPLGVEGVYLLWIPLGAGASVPVAHWSGRAYEAISARRARRTAAAICSTRRWRSRAGGHRFVVEMTPAWGSAHTSAGSVASGPVAFQLLGRSRFFRYEVHCWRDGVIPTGTTRSVIPRCVSNDPDDRRSHPGPRSAVPNAHDGVATTSAPGTCGTPTRSLPGCCPGRGSRTADVHPPRNGRAPGWRAGLVASGADGRVKPVPLQDVAREPAAADT